MFTRMQYLWLANTLAEIEAPKSVVEAFAKKLEENNPMFKPERFAKAYILKASNVKLNKGSN